MTAQPIGNMSAAIYARVSSDVQAQEQTIDSQVAKLRKQVMDDGVSLDEKHCFLDDGVSGSTLNRPALERLRDAAYVGAFQRLYVHSPDRLARKYAYQVLIVDELQKQGIDIIFLNRAIGVSPVHHTSRRRRAGCLRDQRRASSDRTASLSVGWSRSPVDR